MRRVRIAVIAHDSTNNFHWRVPARRPNAVMSAVAARPRWNTRWPDVAFAVLVVMTFVGLLYLGRSLTFWQDEWSFIDFDSHGSLLAYLVPHNEHWSTVPRIFYAALLALFGMRSYLPYLSLLLVLHLFAVVAVYVLLARRHTRLIALAMAVPLLVLGSGYGNLFWAFQIGFVGSTAAGVWALVALESPGRRNGALGSVLLLVSLASSGMGLFFLAAAAVRLVAEARLRERIPSLALPTGSYILWYLAFGRAGLAERGQLATLSEALDFAARGLLHSIARFSGLDAQSGWLGSTMATVVLPAMLLFAGLMTLVWMVVRRRTVPPLALAALTAFIVMYAVIGLVRAQLTSDFAERSRYVYVAAFFMVLLVGDLLAGISWQVYASRAATFVVAPLLVLSITTNAMELKTGRDEFQIYADLTRSYVTIIEQSHDRTWMDPAGLLLEWPTVDEVRALVDRYGNPAADEFLPQVATRPSDGAFEQALLRLVGRGFRVGSGPSSSPTKLALRVVAFDGTRPASDGVCLAVVPTGSSPSVTVQVPSGTWIEVLGSGGIGSALLGHQLRPSPRTRISFVLSEVPATYVRIPDIGDGTTWQVKVELPSTGMRMSLCSIGQAPAAESVARPAETSARR